MNYVEMLRVRNGLRVLAIVLAAIVILAGVLRISVNGQLNGDQFIIDQAMKDPGTKVTQSGDRTVITDPVAGVTITVQHVTGGGRIVQIDEPSGRNSSIDRESQHTIGSVRISDSEHNGTRRTTIDTSIPIPGAIFLAIATLAGLIMATVFGAAFAKENEGHLEIALLKPISRERYALGAIAVDLAGILAAEILALIAALLATVMFEPLHLDFTHDDWTWTLVPLAVLSPFAWYALLNAATASLKRGAGALVGFSWPITLVVVGLSQIPFGNPVGDLVHNIFWGLSRLIPLAYMHFGGGDSADVAVSPERVLIMLALFVVYSALAVWQWRRAEA
jgi:hypothetical protein